jgi:ubiquinone/menaquinone biosynthesis C-methylase UbiE
MSSHNLTVDTVNEVGGRRGLDLLVLDRVRIQAWDRVLFVECGDGWIVEEAWRRVPRAYAYGLDNSPAHVELARQLREVPGKLEFKTWDGRRLPCPERGFDRVVATLVFAGALDLATLLREVRRVLRPDGDAYLLHGVAPDAAFPQTFADAGFAQVQELARADGQAAVLVHARPALRVPLAGASCA